MWWNDHPNLLSEEARRLVQYYPQVLLNLINDGGRYCPNCEKKTNIVDQHVLGFAIIHTRLGCDYPCVLAYPCNYPDRIPVVWSKPDLVPKPPGHWFEGGRICLTDIESDPSLNGTLLLGLAYAWFNCYDIWRKTGFFPPKNYGKYKIR